MKEFSVTVKDDLSPTIRRALVALGPGNRRKINNVAARESLNALRRYHRAFDEAGKWRTTRPGGGGSVFGSNIVRGWGVSKVSAGGATLTNQAPYLGFKIRGGTVRAKRWKYLTIPLVPEAKGRFAKEYQRVTGKKLFRPGKSMVLAEADKGSSRGFKAIYALKETTKHKPLPGAMPAPEVYAAPFVKSIIDQLSSALR
jgi:hypothetical protein